MKKAICYSPLILFARILFFVACKKQDIGNDNKTNQPPVANAGPAKPLPYQQVPLLSTAAVPPIPIITLLAIYGQKLQGLLHLPLRMPIPYKPW
jgi:hypothetical protein